MHTVQDRRIYLRLGHTSLGKRMQYKSQHFVPKCYLRPFTIENNDRSIGVYNIRRNLFIPRASIKDQCASDYFYDRTGEMEKIFGGCEGEYSRIIKKIAKYLTASEEDLSFLKYFAYLQYLRTDAWAKHQALAITNMTEFVFENDPAGRSWATIDPKKLPGESLGHFLHTAPYLMGLRDCIVVNQSNRPFITSDNPAVIVNRFHVQKGRHRYGGAGLINSGCMLVLPISPRVVFVAYDQGIYTATLQGGPIAFAKRPRDIDALNALQILKASDNIYFNDVNSAGYIKNVVSEYKERRPDAWHRWHFAVEETGSRTDTHKRYRVVDTPAEFQSGNGLMHMQSISVDPGIWCSIFSFRKKPSFVDTRSAVGLVRSQRLLDLREILREPPASAQIPR